jgi:RimJ/RimL family protein N-acetyltransferase
MRIQKPPAVDHPDISLRQLERSDIPAWYAYLSQREVIQHTSWDLKTQSDLLPLFDELDSTRLSSNRRLAIIHGANRELIGTIGFHTISDKNRSAEIAYDLSPAYWGKGIASAVCSAITQWAFLEYGFVRVQGTVLVTNPRSANVLKKSGYQYEGTLRSFRMVRGSPGDFEMYALLNTDRT